MATTDIAQVLMTWEPDDEAAAIARVTRSIESFAAACTRAGMRGSVVMVDGAFDAAVQGTGLPHTSPDSIDRVAAQACAAGGLEFHACGPSGATGAWPSEGFKLTAALRVASSHAPILLRLDSDEVLTDDSDLGALRSIERHRMHGASVTWRTVGEHCEGSQQPGTKQHLRAFAASPTLTAGPAYHGSYKVYDEAADEWLALRKRGDENTGLTTGKVLDLTAHITIENRPEQRSAAMHEAKRRLLAHRYEGARSDR